MKVGRPSRNHVKRMTIDFNDQEVKALEQIDKSPTRAIRSLIMKQIIDTDKLIEIKVGLIQEELAKDMSDNMRSYLQGKLSSLLELRQSIKEVEIDEPLAEKQRWT